MESISWLETYLLNYPGAVFIVSHDRYFLDKVVTKVVEIEAGNMRMYSGNYSAYALKKAQLRDAQYKAYLNQQRDIKHQEAVIAKLKSFNREKSIKRAFPWNQDLSAEMMSLLWKVFPNLFPDRHFSVTSPLRSNVENV